MKKEEKTELTKAKIFAAAMKEFGTKGYVAGSINEICKTGINKGLIYHNFKDKDELYLECVKKCCEDFIAYVIAHKGEAGFVEYMSARMGFFKEQEHKAYLFLEARTNPPRSLIKEIQKIYTKFDELNLSICKKELEKHELREEITEEEALDYFSEIQKIFNLNFSSQLTGEMSPQEQIDLHEKKIQKWFNIMLYGIAKGGNET